MTIRLLDLAQPEDESSYAVETNEQHRLMYIISHDAFNASWEIMYELQCNGQSLSIALQFIPKRYIDQL